jgi:hypothetical protein
MSGNQSRYIRTVRTKLPKRKRVVKLHGAFEDDNRWFYCWNCGFINNVDRNANFEGYGNEGIDFIPENPTPQEEYHDLGMMPDNTLNMELVGEIGTVLKTGHDGTPVITYYTPRRVNNTKGCSLCGATNIFG